ncbi:MAG: serine--tRNA ligase [Alphaproteobacteria bacterium]|nr:serine--tRNA ligase [Alphaproteobacteria bacterium]
MIDINLVKANPDRLKNALLNRNKKDVTNELLELHNKYLNTITQLQNAREERNKLTESFANAKRNNYTTIIQQLAEKLNELKTNISSLEEEGTNNQNKYKELLSTIPNIPDEECPIGKDEKSNKILKQVGIPRQFSFKPKEHNELGENLGLMDFKRAAKIAGSRFVFLFSDLCRLERALAQFMLDLHRKNGYKEVYVPLIVQYNAMFGTGQLPKFEEDLFKTTINTYLIPTAEVALTNIYNNEILKEEDLPIRVTAYTPCFRSEAGSAGKDTTGMIRQHQFTKVELVSITTPDQSKEEHERMTCCAEEVLEKLELPYQRVLLSTGDMGFSSEKTYDLEVWLPGQNQYREISSCSRCNTFQARRMNTRYKNEKTKKNEFVHTLNGSGVAVGRCLIAVMENYQQEDGSIIIPNVLQKYMGGQKVIEQIN